ncbi:vesicular glutamate transporter 1-like isoform X2 [Periplaneta americana]|uniref:vesicular glutamate transporter 1-like isoform X2 n=1 Tax=Periplaneta americana TaxID=6978 RepID=UPI0037E7A0B1
METDHNSAYGSTEPLCRTQGDGLGPGWKFWRRRRFIVASLAFFGFFMMQTERVNLSVTIISMTSPRSVNLTNGTTVLEQDFHWDPDTEGLVLGSYFYGYIMTQLLGGWLATYIGANKVFGVGILGAGVLTLVTPFFVYLGVYVLVAVRVMEGLFLGLSFPCMHSMWSTWAPPSERSTLSAVALSGNFVGMCGTFVMSGAIADNFGWPYVFYVFGGMALVWSTVWFIVVKNQPKDDPYISLKEKKYIQDSLGPETNAIVVRPWIKFWTSLPFWAVIVIHSCDNWCTYTLLTELPAFMKDSLDMELTASGMITAPSFLAMGVTLMAAGRLADWLVTSGRLTTTQVRKLYCCCAYSIQATLVFVVGSVQNTAVVIACITFIVIMGGIGWSAFSVNYIDLAPKHASVLLGLSNTIATIPGILSPSVTGWIVRHDSWSEWRIIFYITGGLSLGGVVFYAIFGTGEQQSWALDEQQSEEVNKADTN